MGRLAFGLASLLIGLADVALNDQLISSWTAAGDAVFLYVISAALIAGGVAILIPRTVRLGAGILGVAYAVVTLTFVPDIVKQPGAYYTWGNAFYPLAPVAGAAVAYCMASPVMSGVPVICKAAVVLLGVCNASYAIEQVEFLARTASLVPSWLPPSGTFWADATTAVFGLTAIAMITGHRAKLAARLTALMFIIFGIAVWIPILIKDPKTHANWSEGLETFAIAGAVWIIADYLGRPGIAQAAGEGGSPSW